jgi:hypothetical protein
LGDGDVVVIDMPLRVIRLEALHRIAEMSGPVTSLAR